MRFNDKDSYVLVEFCEMIVGKQKPCEGMKNLMLKDLDDGSGSEENLTMVVQVLLFGELVILPELKKLRIIVNKTFLHPARPSWKFCPFECLGCSHIQHDKAKPESVCVKPNFEESKRQAKVIN